MLRYDRCRTCGIRWHREHGFELGPIALNVVLTFGALAIGMIVAFAVTLPDAPALAITLILLAVAIVLPLLLFPFTNTVWMAFDLLSHRPDEQELAEAAAAVEAEIITAV
jgi:hypothetical protein